MTKKNGKLIFNAGFGHAGGGGDNNQKGKLNLISRNTSEGIMCQIINENNELLRDDKTFLWYNDIKFSCEPNEGLIVLPYKILSEEIGRAHV